MGIISSANDSAAKYTHLMSMTQCVWHKWIDGVGQADDLTKKHLENKSSFLQILNHYLQNIKHTRLS